MSHSAPRLLRALAVAALAAGSLTACSRTDTRPAGRAPQVSAGDVAPTGKSSAGDSIIGRADAGRIRGADSARVWLVEVSDFQCPYCRQWHDQVFAAIDREYVQTGKVRMAYLNFPLSMHANAQAASEAAMCASAQGKFWELHDSVFGTQEKWAGQADPMPTFDSLAVAAGANQAAWRACMTSHATAALITADRERAGRSGVRSTPTVFVADRAFVGLYPIDSVRAALDAAIAKSRAAR